MEVSQRDIQLLSQGMADLNKRLKAIENNSKTLGFQQSGMLPISRLISNDADPNNTFGMTTSPLGMQLDQRNSAGRSQRMYIIDVVVEAATTFEEADAFPGADGALILLWCSNPDTGADLGHILGGGSTGRYATTTAIEASSSGTTPPSVQIGTGYSFAAHATQKTRFTGVIIIGY